jgi:hypothetical protein
MKLIPLPAFQDKDLWVSHDGRRALLGTLATRSPHSPASGVTACNWKRF